MASGGLPVAHIRSMEQVRGESTARTDFNMTLLMIFAGVALLLAAIGIYGLMAYSVQQRTQDLWARIARGSPDGSRQCATAHSTCSPIRTATRPRSAA